MYSLVSLCKQCQQRVLDGQLHYGMVFSRPEDCIYCYMDYLKQEMQQVQQEVELARLKRQDHEFALELLDFNYTEMVAAYEAAVFEVEKTNREIHELRNQLQTLQSFQNFQSSRKDLLE